MSILICLAGNGLSQIVVMESTALESKTGNDGAPKTSFRDKMPGMLKAKSSGNNASKTKKRYQENQREYKTTNNIAQTSDIAYNTRIELRVFKKCNTENKMPSSRLGTSLNLSTVGYFRSGDVSNYICQNF